VRRRILLSLLGLFAIFAAAALVAILHIRSTTSRLEHVVTLHQIEELRQDLVISAQAVQSNLYSSDLADGDGLAPLVTKVSNLRRAARQCQGCHHTVAVRSDLEDVDRLVDGYSAALSYYVTARASAERRQELRAEAAQVGQRLFSVTERMAADAGQELNRKTTASLASTSRVQVVLLASLGLAIVAGGLLGLRLTRQVTRPIGEMVAATRRIRSGDLDVRLDETDSTEFGMLAKNFNAMGETLARSYGELENEIERHCRTLDALGRSESFLRTVFDSIRDPFLVFDHNGRAVRVNRAYAEIADLPFEAVVGRSCDEVFGLCAGSDCIVAETVSSRRPETREVRLTRGDGREAWYAIHTYPIIDDDDRVTHVIAYSRDISDREAAERALLESNERFELAARGANDGLWDWNVATGDLHVSSRWLAILGRGQEPTESDLQGWLEKVHPLDRDRVREKLHAHLERRIEQFRDEHRMRRSDGEWLWVLSRGLAIRDGSGKAHRMAGSMTDISDRKRFEQELVHSALHDPLTGLPNRPLIRDRLERTAARSKRDLSHRFAVLFLDLDRFKVVNDTLGHPVGDRVLAEVAERLQSCVRENDTVGRLGGDEFVIILDGLHDPEEAVLCGERIGAALEPPCLIDDRQVSVRASVGIVTSATEFEKSDDLLRYADVAMYRAKAQENGHLEVFSREMDGAAMESLDLEAGLRFAVSRKQLVLHYQPIFAARSRRILGFEALLRWRHPQRGLLEPETFLHLAEERGLITEIGAWVLEEALARLADVQRSNALSPPLFMSVNVSSKQLIAPEFVDRLEAQLALAGIAAPSLRLELTESVLVDESSPVLEILERLARLGVGISLDDFGTGYSSLSYLDRLPIHTIKIDASFIRKLSATERTPEILRTIVTLARSLGLEVVAEGIEEKSQLERLADLDCELLQGFYLGKPVPSGELEGLLGETVSASATSG
jgi:diguanylate cyclase (GGDEF)-like protein/PAS domain S-box-containing protein